VSLGPYGDSFRNAVSVDLGYARVSTTKQDLDRQIDALLAAGIPARCIYLDKKSGATVDRPGLRGLLDYARAGDVIVVHTLDRLGRTVRDTLNLIHELTERGVGLRNLADPIQVDSSRPENPMAQLALVLLALFAQMERTYTLERAAHARAVATSKGRRIGRPCVVDAKSLEFASYLRDQGHTISQIVDQTGITDPASTDTCHHGRSKRSPQPASSDRKQASRRLPNPAWGAAPHGPDLDTQR
jgi:DNA invertase Pin-like site-specific DNA recombinase